jgi:hypothetical protein
MFSIAGSLVTYIVWRTCYQIALPLPYEPELPFLFEALWGMLLGLGPFAGIATLRTLYGLRDRPHDPARLIQAHWSYPALAALGGLLGGSTWWMMAAWIPLDSTGPAMTALWSTMYISTILLVPVLVHRPRLSHRSLFFLLLLPALPFAGFLLTWFHINPDQADFDMLVGLAIRAAVVIGAVLIMPTVVRREIRYPALATHVNVLVDAILRRRPELTKTGTQLYLGQRVSYSRESVRKFCSGERKPGREAALSMLQVGAEFGLERGWGEGFLRASNHFNERHIAQALSRVFDEGGKASAESERPV